MTLCAVAGCERPTLAGGLCSKHYQRVWSRGTTADPIRLTMSPEDRFWPKVNKQGGYPDFMDDPLVRVTEADGECWIWTGAIGGKGYGAFNRPTGSRVAHVISWEWANGRSRGEAMDIDHLCRVHACVRPGHLEEVTRKENARRGLAPVVNGRHNSKKTHCPQGHPYSGDNLYVNNGHRQCRRCKSDFDKRKAGRA